MITARRLLAGAGVQTATLAFGGSSYRLLQEQQKNMMVILGQLPRKFKYGKTALAGCGTQTSALAFGGEVPPITTATEEYNGITWATSTGLNTARSYLAGCGTQTAALGFGGEPTTGATELYDGTTWTSSPASLNTARNALAGAGTQTAALAFGGAGPSFQQQQKNLQ
jgi:hypothetical protein